MIDKSKITNKLINFLASAEKPMRRNEISKYFQFPSDSMEYEELLVVLDELLEQGMIEKSSRRRYSLKEADRIDTLVGVLRTKNEKSFVETERFDIPVVVVKQRHLNTAFDGDKVEVKLRAAKKRKKPQGEVVKVIERATERIVGTIEKDGNFHFLIPDEDIYYIDLLVPEKDLNGAKPNDKVIAEMKDWSDPQKSPKAEVVKILGSTGDLSVEFESVLFDFDLSTEFRDEVTQELDDVSNEISAREIKRRMDLRDEDIITIDPEDARDFDDALSLKKLENGNWLLGVHIADVSHYVVDNTFLDDEAAYRGTSVYLVDRVVPMLPEKLSNNICSLRPNEDRLAFTVLMEMSPRAVVKDYQVVETVINSKRRFTYTEALDIIEGKDGDMKELILNLHKLSRTMRNRRFRLGGVNFDTKEIRFKLDENKKPVEVVEKSSNEATELVEECMLAANQQVALHVKKLAKQHKKRKLPYIFRIHEEPDQKKLKEALKFISQMGIHTRKKDVKPKDLNELIKNVEERKEKSIIHNVLVRSMARAVYSIHNPGHYGLGFSDYTHFTSPIRRYPDLLVHRLIKYYTKVKSLTNKQIEEIEATLLHLAQHSSDRERVAVDAERQSIKLANTIMADEHVGDVFYGSISGVTSFGLFVYLDDIYAEGLLHIKDLFDDYYLYDEKNFCIKGKRSKKKFKYGDRIKVKIIKTNIEKRKIDLAYVNS